MIHLPGNVSIRLGLLGVGCAAALVLAMPWATAQEASRLEQSLELADWTESRFAKFQDGVPLDVDERAEVERLVARLAAFDRRVYRDSPATDVTIAQLRDDPAAWRGKFVRLEGRLAAAVAPLAEEPPAEGPSGPYLVDARRDDGRFTAAVATVPRAWREHRLTDQRLVVEGVFVKHLANGEGEAAPLIAAKRVAWYPQQVEPPAVNYGMSVLGSLGIDVAGLDSVVQRQPLGRSETAAFYHVLAGLRSTSAPTLVQWAERYLPRHRAAWAARLEEDDPQQRALAAEVVQMADSGRYSVAPFFNAPRQQVGQLVVFDGILRRALRVVTTDDIDAQAAGIDQYYELAVFTEDSQNNPLLFCVLDVPPELPLGDEVRAQVRVAGFFFKTWRYRGSEADEEITYRFAPMFLGRGPLKVVPPEPSSLGPWLMGGGFALLVVIVWLAVWRATQSDRAFAAQTLRRMQQVDEPPDFAQQGPEPEARDVSGNQPPDQ